MLAHSPFFIKSEQDYIHIEIILILLYNFNFLITLEFFIIVNHIFVFFNNNFFHNTKTDIFFTLKK